MAESIIQSEVDHMFRRVGITGQAAAILMVVFGVLILVFPELVGILVGVYLIVVGLLQLLGSLETSRPRAAPPPATPPGGALPPPPLAPPPPSTP